MIAILTQVDAWILAVVLAVVMIGGWALGFRTGQQKAKQGDHKPPNRLADATLALLGLLLGFTFSMSLGKHEQRRLMVVTDANAIGDFHTCVSLTKNNQARKNLLDVIQKYAKQRLALANAHVEEEKALQLELAKIDKMHARMVDLSRTILDDGTAVAVPLTNTLNGVTSNTAARLAASRDRLPSSVVMLLFLASVVSMALLGRQQGMAGEHHRWSTSGFIVLVCMVVWVTMDLNQPRHGWIVVSQEPMERLVASFEN